MSTNVFRVVLDNVSRVDHFSNFCRPNHSVWSGHLSHSVRKKQNSFLRSFPNRTEYIAPRSHNPNVNKRSFRRKDEFRAKLRIVRQILTDAGVYRGCRSSSGCRCHP